MSDESTMTQAREMVENYVCKGAARLPEEAFQQYKDRLKAERMIERYRARGQMVHLSSFVRKSETHMGKLERVSVTYRKPEQPCKQ